MLPIIIPVFKPNKNLITLIEKLQSQKVNNIIVVADGLVAEYKDIFDKVKTIPGCDLLVHSVNLGKGRALKTAFNYVLKNYPTATGVVTADADGQHSVIDILKVAASLEKSPNMLVLGCRRFDKDVPLRSKFGNSITRHVMSFLLGAKLSDTQTGLRGIPIGLLKDFMLVKGERYEYETGVLIEATQKKTPIKEETIQTIYIDHNKSSGFNPILDSMKIYFLLLRFSCSGLISAVIDYLLFTLILYASGSIFFASYGARSVALGVNFYLNKNFVFRNHEKNIWILLKYLLLCLIMVTISYTGIKYTVMYSIMPATLAKFLLETVLFCINMEIQRRFIFKNYTKVIKK